jgi:hypothetical protein
VNVNKGKLKEPQADEKRLKQQNTAKKVRILFLQIVLVN